ncbi:MAG: hypothetical protein IT179_14125 [Acidobacteria bacterium]|nr:hypothetical protein [Acidobacteriota bacterium]
MTRRAATTLITGLLLAGLAPAATLAHPGHDRRILGTVIRVAGDHLMVKDRQGRDHTIRIDGATRVLRDRKPVHADAIEEGLRVAVTAVTEDEALVARTIELGRAPTRKP